MTDSAWNSAWTRRDFLRRSAVATGAALGAPAVFSACGGGGVEQLAVTEAFSPVINGEKKVQCGGFVFRPGNDQLRMAFNRELRRLQQSGRWVDIVSQFPGFGRGNLPPGDVSTEQLCGQSPGPGQLGGGGRGGLLGRLRQQGAITVGIANEAPFGFRSEQGEVAGEAPAVAKAVFNALGIPELRAKVVDFGSLIPGLNANRFDMVAAGMYITPERCASAAFSVPDYCAPTAFLVPQGNPQNVTRFTDIARNQNISLGVLGGAVEGDYARQQGVPDSRITTFDGKNDLYQGVLDQRVYCGSLTDISLTYLLQQRQS